MLFRCSIGSLLLLAGLGGRVGWSQSIVFEKTVLSERFYSEGADAGDIDGDGVSDIVSGPFYYPGPEFQQPVRYRPGGEFPIAGYSDQFFTFVDDIDRDGDRDILVIPIPGAAAHWFENPGRTNGGWAKHLIIDKVDGESPAWLDVHGDGQKELVCIYGGALGYVRPGNDVRDAWTFVRISPNRNYGRFTHGLGVGDVDGDGRLDFLETNGWWRQPDNYQEGDLFQFQPVRLAQGGGAQMFAVDVDGDGDNDIISSQNAHGFGLGWFEQREEGGEIAFPYHEIMGSDPDDGAFSQLHAVEVADIDGDGRLDIVTGKRFWAHGGRDPDATNDPVLVWFRNEVATVADSAADSAADDESDGGRVVFRRQQIDARVGVGTQVTVKDINGDDRLDVIVGNKLGTFALVQTDKAGAATDSGRYTGVAPGSPAFSSHVRPTDPLSPDEERRSFRLPDGFEVTLVASEPQIAKPLNLAFDVRGRLWVTSSLEYPYAAPADAEHRDTIKVLEDKDGDGHFESVQTFAEGLNIPIGLYPYGDGVICFSIPHIWFLRDTDGDGKADIRQRLYGPMGYERDTHGMCNAFRRGFDGWLYACHGFNNQTRVAGTDGHEISMQSGNTFRMRVDGRRVEQFTWGQVNPFGMTIDASGDFLTADCHTKPVTLLLPGGYYESFGKPHDGLGFVPPVMDHLHGSTAIAGITPLDAKSFPKDYDGSTLGGNVMTSRINRNTLVLQGSTVRAREEPDFLVAGDPWFRPVDVRLGPDGAIYVADFYNKIIGHYEVPLDHPGRDRHRGRIWRIRYVGHPTAEQAATGSLRDSRIDNLSVSELFDAAAEANSVKLRMIVNHLCDSLTAADLQGEATKRLMRAEEPEQARVAALWALTRHQRMDGVDLADIYRSATPLLRGHLMHAAAFSQSQTKSPDDQLQPKLAELVASGLADENARVRRFAAQAARALPGVSLESLFTAHARAGDPHLQHAVKIAIRDRLRDENQFARWSASRDPHVNRALIEIALALDHQAAGNFLVDALVEHADDWPAARREDVIRHAATTASGDRIVALSVFIQKNMKPNEQRELLLVIRQGLAEKGDAIPLEVQRWASQMAQQLFEKSRRQVPPIPWRYTPLPGQPRQASPFVVQQRKSADGREESFFCTLPAGESRTGIYRSAAFAAGSSLSFFTAGHIGPPNEPVVAKNFIRLRDALDHRLYREAKPPRNDTAQRVTWDLQDLNGKDVYVEIVDGDTRNAYAWLAVGRFSEAGLNPSTVDRERTQAAELVGAFRLTELEDELREILTDRSHRSEADRELVLALSELRKSSRMAACAEVLTLPAISASLRSEVVASVFQGDAAMEKSIAAGLRTATSLQQGPVAKRLVADAEGCQLLVTMLEKGAASPTLLLDPAILDRLRVVSAGRWKQRVDSIAQAVETQAALQQQQHLQQRLDAYLAKPGDVEAGKLVFKKHCSQCHQAAGEGAKIAPQLDGVRSRGVARLVEDIVAPNRNVDVAFRTTTFVTVDGRVINGIVRSEDKQKLVVVNQEGKEVTLAVEDIDERVPSASSLMPANVMQQVQGDDWNHLIAYLLSLK